MTYPKLMRQQQLTPRGVRGLCAVKFGINLNGRGNGVEEGMEMGGGSGISGGSMQGLPGCMPYWFENRPNHLLSHGIDMHLLVELTA
jgi:hypothetical protein